MKPILFSQEFIPKILSGEKTVTRRLVKPLLGPEAYWSKWESAGEYRANGLLADIPKEWRSKPIYSPYLPGDVLWVRETWKPCDCGASDCRGVIFPDHLGKHWIKGAWRPSIHMPRWAARIFLEVTDVRVERVQEITEAEAIAEGYHADFNKKWWDPVYKCWVPCSARMLFEASWSDRYPGSWDRNDYVWVISFKRTEKGA